MYIPTRYKLVAIAVIIVCAAILLSSCALGDKVMIDLEKGLKGRQMAMNTYDQQCNPVDEVSGKGVSFKRAENFDMTTGADSKELGDVIELSVGKNVVYHVGSTMLLRDSDLPNLVDQIPPTVNITNDDPAQIGRPWLNYLREDYGKIFKGKAKVALIRSQDGTPCAVFAGDEVNVYSTDVPKSTELIIDGKLLVVYRADYTIYDTALLK